MRTLAYVLLYLLILQFAIPFFFPLHTVYPNRIDYEMAKSNLRDIDVTIEKLKTEIKKRSLREGQYIVLLGDSVMFASPGNSEQSVNKFMKEQIGPSHSVIREVFNLSFPAMQIGDIYVMMLKLKKAGISTEHLILNVRYASFVPREPGPPAVFWLKDDLRRLDKTTFEHIRPQLEANGYKRPEGMYRQYQEWLKQVALPLLKPYAYKDYFEKYAKHKMLTLRHLPIPDDALGDSRAWNVRRTPADWHEFIQGVEIQQNYTDRPLDFSENNPDIYFLNKIIEMQNGNETLVVLTGTNQTMMESYIEKTGYQDNLSKLAQHIKDKPVHFLSVDTLISDDLFNDHTHYTPEGYEQLAGMIWQRYSDILSGRSVR